MRQNDPPNVFQKALCAAGCGSSWAKWCRGCNLVYCGRHVEYKAHKCKRLDLQRGAGIFGPPEKPKKRKPRSQKPSANGNGQKELPAQPQPEPPKEAKP